jgi:glutaredoxin
MFTVYSKPDCGFCEKAKALLMTKNLKYDEVIVDTGVSQETGKKYVTVDELRKLIPNVRSVPQIFKENEYIGGYEALRKILS